METPVPSTPFSSPEEEIAYLRGQVAEKERALEERGIPAGRERVVKDAVERYSQLARAEALAPTHAMPEHDVIATAEKIVLDLSPEAHDETMGALIDMIQSKGVLNTIAVVERMGQPHLSDDLHRFLVAYVAQGLPTRDLTRESSMHKRLSHTLFEIAIHEGAKSESEHAKTLKELLSAMDQFYSGMLSAATPDDAANALAIELANPQGTAEFVFYASVPNDKCDLFEKQLLSVFPKARLHVAKDDYNVFVPNGGTAGSIAKLKKNAILPIKQYDKFDHDPLSVILNSLSKLKDVGEGAAIQLVFVPTDDRYFKAYKKALDAINKGESAKEAMDIRFGFWSKLGKDLKDVADVLGSDDKKKTSDKVQPVDQILVENIQRKIASPIVTANIRIVASAETQERAESILAEIESSFNQFTDPTANGISFDRKSKRALTELCKDFSFRAFSETDALPLSISETTTIMHLPEGLPSSAPTLRTSRAASAPAPLEISSDGVLLGKNVHRGAERLVHMAPEDRLRHMYVIGQTGTGKTTLLKNMIIQDIKNGDGVCMIDPHGSDIQDILANIPKERFEDVIYFDPSHTDRPMALNMLEYDARYPEQKTFVVNEMLAIFNKLFDMKVAGGPAFEQYFRNSALLVMEHPESGNTLLEIARILSDKAFRDLKLSHCKNPLITQFWQNAEKTTGEAALANYVPYITNKFDVFVSNDIMRPIIAQERSSFNFRDVMDNRKILLVNLSKGRLGDINSSLLGLILVGKILMAALSRADAPGTAFPPFYLYIDEFQNITTDSISTILSEARKYKLSLTIAHQYIAQLEEGIKNSVFGNVGTIASYRVGADDAEFLQKQFEPSFTATDIMNLDNHNAYLRMLAHGRPAKPFNIEKVAFPPAGNPKIAEMLKELSYLKYGRDRERIETEIMAKYKK